MTRKLVDAAVDLSSGEILYRDFIIIPSVACGQVVWDWVHEDDRFRPVPTRSGMEWSLQTAIAAIDAWHDQQVAA